MKLIDLLCENMDVWPEGVSHIAQDKSGSIYGYGGEPEMTGSGWFSVYGFTSMPSYKKEQLCADWSEATVSLKDWSAAKGIPVSAESVTGHLEQEPDLSVIDTGFSSTPAEAMQRLQEITSAIRDLMAERKDICTTFQINLD